ncbi:MAG: hypothetical protein ACO1QR_02415 [Chthoniobacteraceae bacterium]
MKTFPPVTMAVALILAAPALAEPTAKPPQEKAVDAAKVKLKFQAYDGDPAKPESLTFQINKSDLREPVSFVRIGEAVERTNYRVTSFAYKTRKGTTGMDEDASELTLTDTKTKKTLVLQLPPLRHSN